MNCYNEFRNGSLVVYRLIPFCGFSSCASYLSASAVRAPLTNDNEFRIHYHRMILQKQPSNRKVLLMAHRSAQQSNERINKVQNAHTGIDCNFCCHFFCWNELFAELIHIQTHTNKYSSKDGILTIKTVSIYVYHFYKHDTLPVCSATGLHRRTQPNHHQHCQRNVNSSLVFQCFYCCTLYTISWHKQEVHRLLLYFTSKKFR